MKSKNKNKEMAESKTPDFKMAGLLLTCVALFGVWSVMSQVPERKEAEKVKPAKWQNYTLALQQNAHKQGKPVIIDFSAEW